MSFSSARLLPGFIASWKGKERGRVTGGHFGPGAVGGLSGSAIHPATAAMPNGGHAHGPLRVLEYITPDVGADKWHYRFEDQLGSLSLMKAVLPFRYVRFANGMADDAATKLADFAYLDYGRPIERRSRETRCVSRVRGLQPPFDGDISLVVPFLTLPDTPVAGQTTIGLTSGMLDTDQLKGMQIAIALPEHGEFWVETVLSNTTSTIIVDDASYLIYSGLDEGLSFVVYDFVDTNVHTSGDYHTAGTWTNAPSYGSGVTTFTDSGADFSGHMVGWLLSPTVENFAYLEIIEASATTLTVKGDARGLADNGGRYWVFAPPHVSPGSGAIRGEYDADLFIPACDTRYLWALYRYMPPMAGFEVDLDGPGIYGRQTGTNQSGHHHAQNRVYDPATGRWTTTDPAASPWSNLWDCVGARPLSNSDPSGLKTEIDAELISGYWVDSFGSSTARYHPNTCDRLLTAIKKARYDLAHASQGMGHGRLPEIITELEKLYAIRCGKPAAPSSYAILPPPYQPGQGCAAYQDALVRHAFEEQERRYRREQLERRVEGWEFLGDLALYGGAGLVVIGTGGLILLPAGACVLGGCGGGGSGSGPGSAHDAKELRLGRFFDCMKDKHSFFINNDHCRLAAANAPTWDDGAPGSPVTPGKDYSLYVTERDLCLGQWWAKIRRGDIKPHPDCEGILEPGDIP